MNAPYISATANTQVEQIEAQLTFILTHSGPGFIQIGFGALQEQTPEDHGKPRKLDVYPFRWGARGTWRWLDASRISALAADIVRLSQQPRYRNLYITTTTYKQATKRKKDNANPSRIIFCDDVQPGNGESMYIQTSTGKGQAYFAAHTLMDQVTREQASYNAAEALGGDKTHDVTRFARIAGTFNTKYASVQPVRLAHCDPTHTYSLAELAMMHPHVDMPVKAAHLLEFDDHLKAEIEQALGNTDVVKRRLGKNLDSLSWRQWRGEALSTSKRSTTPNVSDTAYALACNLRKMEPEGWPPAEVFALLWISPLCRVYDSKGSDEKQRKIWSAIQASIDAYPDATTTPSRGLTSRTAPIQHIEQRQAAAARTKSPDDLYQWYTQQAVGSNRTVMLSVNDAAQAYGVSRATLIRYEAQLKEAGRIVRRTNNARSIGYVLLLDNLGSISPPQQVVSAPPAQPAPQAEIFAPEPRRELTRYPALPAQPSETANEPKAPTGARVSSLPMVSEPAPVIAAAPETIADAVSAACDLKGDDIRAAWRYFSRTFPQLVARLSPNFAIARGKFAERYESELAFRECAPTHAGALDIVHLGQFRASRRLLQPTLLDVTGVRDLGIDKPLSEASVPATRDIQTLRVPSKAHAATSERDEAHASIARDLAVLGPVQQCDPNGPRNH